MFSLGRKTYAGMIFIKFHTAKKKFREKAKCFLFEIRGDYNNIYIKQ